MQDSLTRRETDGVALRTVGTAEDVSSLRVIEEGCKNEPFSSEAQSGAHTNNFCQKAQSVCMCV